MENMSELNKASFDGDLSALHTLHQANPLILDDEITGGFTKTSLHISATRGHVEFTKKLLEIQPEMAKERSVPQRSTPLHLASAKGYVEIVKMLIEADPDMCDAVDNDGRNPSHISAVKGRTDVLKELAGARPLALKAVVEGDSILHLCVKYNQVDALKAVLEVANMEGEFVNSKNDDGNTILHLAVADKQIEMIKYIINRPQVEVNVTNANGHTTLDILSQSRRDLNDILISDSLQLVGGRRARDLSLRISDSEQIVVVESNQNNQPNQTAKNASGLDGSRKVEPIHLTQIRYNSLLVAAALIAAMSYQAGINPPSGVWQDNVEGKGIKAGTSIMAINYPDEYTFFQWCNAATLVTSMLAIYCVLYFPVRKYITLITEFLLVVSLWTSIMSFSISWAVLSPSYKSYLKKKMLEGGVKSERLLVVLFAFCVLLIFSSVYLLFYRLAFLLRRREPRQNSNPSSQRPITETV